MDAHQTIVTALLANEEQRWDAKKRSLGSSFGSNAS
jgi:hypothetical protein